MEKSLADTATDAKDILYTVEFIGIIFAGTLYDTRYKMFSEAVIDRESGEVDYIPRATPTITHRLLSALLQHPRLNFLVSNLVLNLSQPAGSALRWDQELKEYVFVEGGRIHYGHTFSFFLFGTL